ncbi:tol-pal system-associated acyl-CoA thioesterase [Dichotomicrobium thermohalophilum]|uniref:Acyl-CoA thioester hydrolase n=1 Tax=Dichotomicrobium thermohalophilum TaxID=933063 RepID=A0A397Q4W6_9HYPH|nr:tol-pal system-associated acyl-CoA thioesterase [Dichotomicrobium thermohalophilum]RIA55459.1 acyl-CoA thioester hydrolase [Dichotomicrobium thermohalophilum]
MSEAGAQDWPDLAGRLEAGRHVLPVRVYYEDTDFSGLVYHTSYLRFMERGRSDMIRLLGVHHSALAAGEGARLVFVVRRMEIDFLRPARIDDVLEVVTEPAEQTAAAFTLAQNVMRDGERLVSARVQIVLVDETGRPQRLATALPESVTRWMQSG